MLKAHKTGTQIATPTRVKLSSFQSVGVSDILFLDMIGRRKQYWVLVTVLILKKLDSLLVVILFYEAKSWIIHCYITVNNVAFTHKDIYERYIFKPSSNVTHQTLFTNLYGKQKDFLNRWTVLDFGIVTYCYF